MKINIPLAATLAPSQSTQLPSPFYVYFIGENETFYYVRSDALLKEAHRLQPGLAEEFAKAPRPVLAVLITSTLEQDIQPKLEAPDHETYRAKLVLLLDAYISKCPDLYQHAAVGMNSVVFTAFRKQNGGYITRLCASFVDGRCLNSAEVVGIFRDCLVLPHVRRAYDTDGLARSSAYYEIRASCERVNGIG